MVLWICVVWSPHGVFSCGHVPSGRSSKRLQAQPGPYVQDHQLLAWHLVWIGRLGSPESTDEARTQGPPTFLGGWAARVPVELVSQHVPGSLSWRLLSGTQVMRAALIPRDSLREGVVHWNPLHPAVHIRVQPSPRPAALTQVGWGPTSSSGRVLGTGFVPATVSGGTDSSFCPDKWLRLECGGRGLLVFMPGQVTRSSSCLRPGQPTNQNENHRND